jgi:thioredoxin reductase
MDTEQGYDAIIVGGGPAGLQAALTLGRMHRPVLLLDSGEYRNDPADHLHNFAGFDGFEPSAYRAKAHEDLRGYDTVTLRTARATRVSWDAEQGFKVELEDGDAVHARRVLLATGVRDTLPDKPGLAELFGTVAAHCPYCHGHEYAGEHVALLGGHAPFQAALIERIAPERTVLADGAELPEPMRVLAEKLGVTVRPEPVTGFERTETGAVVHFDGGPDLEVGGLFVGTSFAQSAPFAEQLGLELMPTGCTRVDAMGHTSLAGVYAAGDAAQLAELPMPMAAVLAAASSGLVAASSLDRELMFEDYSVTL